MFPLIRPGLTRTVSMSVHQSERQLRSILGDVPPETIFRLLRAAGYNPTRALEMWFAEHGDATGPRSAEPPMEARRSPQPPMVDLSGIDDDVDVDRSGTPDEGDNNAWGMSPPTWSETGSQRSDAGTDTLVCDATPSSAAKATTPLESFSHVPPQAASELPSVLTEVSPVSDRGAYHAHFLEILSAARDEYCRRLLLPTELAWVDLFLRSQGAGGLSVAAQALYARLLLGRRGPWLRVATMLNYHEVFGPVAFDDVATEQVGDEAEENGARNTPTTPTQLYRPSQDLSVAADMIPEHSASSRFACLQTAISELAAAGLVQTTLPGSGAASVDPSCSRSAVADGPLASLQLLEAKSLAARYKLKPTTTATRGGMGTGGGGDVSSREGGGRDGLLERIAVHVCTSRTLNFFRVKAGSGVCGVPYLEHVHEALADSLVSKLAASANFLTPRPGGCAWRAMKEALNKPTSGPAFVSCVPSAARGASLSTNANKDQHLDVRAARLGHLCIRLTRLPRALFRRLLRLTYVATHTSVAGSGGGAEYGGNDGGAVNGDASVGADDESPIMNTGLMERFGLVRFAPYTIQRTFRLFRDRRAFLLWEASVELRHASGCALFEWESSRGWELKPARAQELTWRGDAAAGGTPKVVGDSSDEEAPARSSSGGEQGRGSTNSQPVKPDRSAAEMGIDQLFFGGPSDAIDAGLSKWLESGSEPVAVIRLALVAVAATDRYLSSPADASSELAPTGGGGPRLGSAPGSRLPTWLEHMGPLAVLISVAKSGVKPLEQMGRFAEACKLLRWLLETTAAGAVAGHRRGEWYVRLAIDLKHLQPKAAKTGAKAKKGASSSSHGPSPEDAVLRTLLEAARADPWVRGGDRLDVLRRLQRMGSGVLASLSGPSEETAVSTKGAASTVSSAEAPLPSRSSPIPLAADADDDDDEDDDFETAPSSRQVKGGSDVKGERQKRKKDHGCGHEAVVAAVSPVANGVSSSLKSRPQPIDDGATKEARGIGWDTRLIAAWLAEGGAALVPPSKLGEGRTESIPRSIDFLDASWLCGCPPVDVVVARRLNREVGVKSRFVGGGEFEDACSVEALALQHYAQAELPSSAPLPLPSTSAAESHRKGAFFGELPSGQWSGLHCEGGQLRELFALLMWPALFATVPDVFQTPFQAAPLDLDCPFTVMSPASSLHPLGASSSSTGQPSPGFYAARSALVEGLLSALVGMAPQALANAVAASFFEHRGVSVRGVDWRRHTPLGLLQATAVCIGGAVLAAAFRALAFDYRHYHGGLPDLLLIRALRLSDLPCEVTPKFSSSSSSVWEVAPAEAWLGRTLASRLDAVQAAQGRSGAHLAAGRVTGVPRRRAAKKGGGHESAEDAQMGLLTSAETGAETGGVSDDNNGDAADGAVEDRPLAPLPIGWRFEARWVEVKGPSDALSERQRAWIVILRAAGGDCRVCRVVDSASAE